MKIKKKDIALCRECRGSGKKTRPSMYYWGTWDNATCICPICHGLGILINPDVVVKLNTLCRQQLT